MKILMFGRGVIATMYGWALDQAGHDVEFSVRPGRAAAYGETIDLDLLDARRRVRYREALEPDHDFDLIVLSVQHYRFAEAAAFLAPRVGKATVLVFSNIWSEPLTAIGSLPVGQVAWGFSEAGGGFCEDGVLCGTLLPSVVFGAFGQPRPNVSRPCARCFATPGSDSRSNPTSAAGCGSISCRTPACTRRA
jgi:2-dehydropantoate 2-reductase